MSDIYICIIFIENYSNYINININIYIQRQM